MEKSKAKVSDSTPAVLGDKESDVLNLDLNNLDASMAILTKLVQGKKIGANTPEEALGIYVKSKELGLPFITTSDHMFMINGKTGVDIHVLRALVLKAGGIYWETVNDASPLYEYRDKTNYVVATGIDDSCLPDGYVLPAGNNSEEMKADTLRIIGIGKMPVFKKVAMLQITNGDANNPALYIPNRITKHIFQRVIKMLDGKYKTISETSSFSTWDAINAGLHLKKDGTVNISSPWLTYTTTMLDHRSWTLGARKIANDYLFGLMEKTELYDVNKIEYKIEDATAEVVSDTNN